MKSYLSLLLSVYFILNSVCSLAAYELGGSIALTSDYVYDGESQSGESPAIQGSVDLGFDNGFYAGVWASSLDYEESYGVDGDVEIDLYIGYVKTINEWVSLDLGIYSFLYPGSDHDSLDYEELSFSTTIKDRVMLGITYNDDDTVWLGKQIRYLASYTHPFPKEWSSTVKLIRTDNEPALLKDDKLSWMIAVNKTFRDLDWELSYWDTDLSRSDTFADIADPRVVLSASYSFGIINSN